jgi:hypothetical protein
MEEQARTTSRFRETRERRRAIHPGRNCVDRFGHQQHGIRVRDEKQPELHQWDYSAADNDQRAELLDYSEVHAAS